MSLSKTQHSAPYFVGIDLGGTSIKCGIVDDLGQALFKDAVSVQTEAGRGVDITLKNMARAARTAVDQAGLSWTDVAAVGLGSPGTMDIPAGILLDPVNLRGPGWQNCPVRDALQREIGKPVAFQNDANSAAYGEYWVGTGREAHSMVLFTLGTGIGCGVIIDNQIIEGRHSHGAECGHMVIAMKTPNSSPRMCGCGRYGCLEAYASATALIKRAQEGLDGGIDSDLRNQWAETSDSHRAWLIDNLAKKGDPFCTQLIRDTAYYLAVGATNLMHMVDPDVIVFGGGMTASGQQLLEWIRADIKQLAFPTPAEKTVIQYAELGTDAGYIGAAGCARLMLKNQNDS